MRLEVPALGDTPMKGVAFDFGPWLFGRRVDVGVFGGSAALALVLALAGYFLDVQGTGDWAWLGLVLAIDVAHVHATWFRTYLDREELGRHPGRYVIVPILLYGLGAYAYAVSPLTFWRSLAYVAAFHFVRQQAGWVAIYRARAGGAAGLDRVIDACAIHAATLFPLFHFHVRRDELDFAWFVPGDFFRLDLAPLLPFAQALWALSLATFALRQIARVIRTGRFAAGKTLVVATTALTWYVGIVATNSDFIFTATNVIPHGVPYAVLLFAYTRERAARTRRSCARHAVAGGIGVFALVLIGFAFVEQLLWDRLVDHERPWLFGDGIELSGAWLGWIVPLLALPQLTHYVLDGLIWRRSENESRPALRAALGFGDRSRGAPGPSPATLDNPHSMAENRGSP